MADKPLTIALSGNPNSGKTTIFNGITGTRQKVGNWPGVTVEKKEGMIHRDGRDVRIVDLPGTYSLTPYSIEEVVARNFITDEHPDVIIDIIDASNLERSLYLATQLREIDCRVVFALNMADTARARGIKINAEKLSGLLDVPVLFTVGNKNKGIDELLDTAMTVAQSNFPVICRRRVQYSRDIETAIERLTRPMAGQNAAVLACNPRWTAIKLLEDDKIVRERIQTELPKIAPTILEQARKERMGILNRYDDDPEILMTDERYGFISGIIKEVLTSGVRQRVDISRRIDLVLTNRFLGFPIFIFFIWAMFQLTFTLGQYPMDWIDTGVSALSTGLSAVLPNGLIKDLLVDGILAGVGGVIVFLPNILILFFCIALFEDTGYMARAAFLMDKIMHMIGLHGKSFIPMLMGFGCSVPAIMATRSLESEKDRILTILITPFMSCSARLPVYVILAGTFFGPRAGTVIFSIYLTGIILAVISGRILRHTLLKGVDAPFVMELPPYRMPMAKNLLIHMWDRGRIFLRRMGGVILIGAVIVWALSSFPRIPATTGMADDDVARRAEQMEQSYMAGIGKAISPVFAPLGIDWRGGVALLSGFIAKEIVVGTLGVLYTTGDEAEGALEKALKSSGMTPLTGLSMMIFVLLYVPCLATVAAIRRETGRLKWMIFSICYTTGLAWLASFIVYRGGGMLGFA